MCACTWFHVCMSPSVWWMILFTVWLFWLCVSMHVADILFSVSPRRGALSVFEDQWSYWIQIFRLEQIEKITSSQPLTRFGGLMEEGRRSFVLLSCAQSCWQWSSGGHICMCQVCVEWWDREDNWKIWMDGFCNQKYPNESLFRYSRRATMLVCQ